MPNAMPNAHPSDISVEKILLIDPDECNVNDRCGNDIVNIVNNTPRQQQIVQNLDIHGYYRIIYVWMHELDWKLVGRVLNEVEKNNANKTSIYNMMCTCQKEILQK